MSHRTVVLVAAVWLGCARGSDGAGAPEADAGVVRDASPNSPRDAGADASTCVGTEGLLACAASCPLSLFGGGARERHDFSTETSLPGWKKGAPAGLEASVANGALVFGPHLMTANWWENYTSKISEAQPGDVLLCAELVVYPDVPGADAGTAATDNTLGLVIRSPAAGPYETSGMTLVVRPNTNTVTLETRTGDQTADVHDSQPLSFGGPGSPAATRIMLYGRGERFVGLARTAGGSTLLRGQYTKLAAGGGLAMVGWRSRLGLEVKSLAFGAPEARVGAALDSLLP